jgi:hypothetical protein
VIQNSDAKLILKKAGKNEPKWRTEIYLVIENLVLPPGCRPYGPEAGPGFFTAPSYLKLSGLAVDQTGRFFPAFAPNTLSEPLPARRASRPEGRLYEPEASTPSLQYTSLLYGVCDELAQIFQ